MSRDPIDVLREQGEEGKHSLPDAPVIHVLQKKLKESWRVNEETRMQYGKIRRAAIRDKADCEKKIGDLERDNEILRTRLRRRK